MKYFSHATLYDWEWMSPEGTTMYGGFGATPNQEFDPRGGALGIENPYSGGGGYGGGGGFGDAQYYSRCEWEGSSIPCSMKTRLDRLQEIQTSRMQFYKDQQKEKGKKFQPPAHRSQIDTTTSARSLRTQKPKGDPEEGDPVEPSSVPGGDKKKDGCNDYTKGVKPICWVQSLPWTFPDVDAAAGFPDPNLDPVGHELYQVQKAFEAIGAGLTQLAYDLAPDYCKAGVSVPAFPKVEFAMTKDFRLYGGGGFSFPPDVGGLANQLKNFNFLPGRPRSVGLKVRAAVSCGYFLEELAPEQRHTSMEGTTFSLSGNVWGPGHVGVAKSPGSGPALEFGYGPNTGIDVSSSREILFGPHNKLNFGRWFFARP